MQRPLIYATVGLVLLLAVAGVGARLALGWLVASDEFRTSFNEVLERSLKTVLPTAITEVKGTRLSGLATLELTGLTVSSSKAIAVAVQVPVTRVTPRLRSLLGAGPLAFDGEATLDDGGNLSLSGTVPRAVLSSGSKVQAGAVTVAGAFDHAHAATFAALVFAAKAGPGFQLASGEATGTFSVTKPLGRHDARHKSGQALVHLGETQWTLASATEKTIKLPPFDLDLALEDYVVRLRSPMTLTERTGRTLVSGSLLLPERADRPARWDLEVEVEGDSGLAGSLAKLLHCAAAVAGPRFHVEGPLGAPGCPAG